MTTENQPEPRRGSFLYRLVRLIPLVREIDNERLRILADLGDLAANRSSA